MTERFRYPPKGRGGNEGNVHDNRLLPNNNDDDDDDVTEENLFVGEDFATAAIAQPGRSHSVGSHPKAPRTSEFSVKKTLTSSVSEKIQKDRQVRTEGTVISI